MATSASASGVLDAILHLGVVAVVRLDRLNAAVPLTRALAAGGVRAVELTMTSPGAIEALPRLRAEVPDDVLLGMGTVLDGATAREAVEAGAQFVVTPAALPEVAVAAREAGVPCVLGALTPTEMLLAHRAGADVVKVFPARLGGPSFVKDVLAPMPFLKLLPSGGVEASNAAEFLHAGAAALSVGGKLVAADVVARSDWDEITRRAATLSAIVQAARVERERG